MSDPACTSPDLFSGESLPSDTTATCESPAYGSAITIDGDDDFKRKARACLDAIKNTPTGAKMLREIESSGHKVTIKKTSGGNGADASSWDGGRKDDGTPGTGCDTTVNYNPDKTQISDGSETWMNRPACIGMAHELVHAWRNAKGINDFTAKGEDMAVGVSPYENEAVTENKIRDEWTPKQPKRPRY